MLELPFLVLFGHVLKIVPFPREKREKSISEGGKTEKANSFGFSLFQESDKRASEMTFLGSFIGRIYISEAIQLGGIWKNHVCV